MKLLTSPTSNTYCVPTALALITGKHVDDICNLLKEKYLGDQPISGIYLGPAIDLLKQEGFTVIQDYTVPWTFPDIRKKSGRFGWIYFLGFKKHVGVIFDGKYYDNSNPEGTSTMPRYRIESVWLVTR